MEQYWTIWSCPPGKEAEIERHYKHHKQRSKRNHQDIRGGCSWCSKRLNNAVNGSWTWAFEESMIGSNPQGSWPKQTKLVIFSIRNRCLLSAWGTQQENRKIIADGNSPCILVIIPPFLINIFSIQKLTLAWLSKALQHRC